VIVSGHEPDSGYAFAGSATQRGRDEDPRREVVVSGGYGTAIGSNPSVVQHYYQPTTASAVWPILVGRPPLSADAYQERLHLRSRIDQILDRGATTLVTSVLAGDGGTGKTQLAAAVYRSRVGAVDFAIWVSATSRTAMVTAYAQAATRLWPGSIEEPDDLAAAFLNWLATTDRRWLIVFDDISIPLT
jgi:hypothetical protein